MKHPELDKELLKFVLYQQRNGLYEDLVNDKAYGLRVSHDIEDYDLKLSKGCLQSFTKRNIIKIRALTGDHGSFCTEEVQVANFEVGSLNKKMFFE